METEPVCLYQSSLTVTQIYLTFISSPLSHLPPLFPPLASHLIPPLCFLPRLFSSPPALPVRFNLPAASPLLVSNKEASCRYYYVSYVSCFLTLSFSS